MQGRRKTGRTLGEHEIFGDEQAAKLQAEVVELRQMVADLSAQVHAQFTTISAHAEIAREQVELARNEARADLERTRELLIRLVERTREDLSDSDGFRIPGTPPGPSMIVQTERIESVESRLTDALAGIDRCFERQRVLADTMEALIDTVWSERRGEPVASLSLA
jgi:hypothetical protein